MGQAFLATGEEHHRACYACITLNVDLHAREYRYLLPASDLYQSRQRGQGGAVGEGDRFVTQIRCALAPLIRGVGAALDAVKSVDKRKTEAHMADYIPALWPVDWLWKVGLVACRINAQV